MWAPFIIPWQGDGSAGVVDAGAVGELVARYAAAGAHGVYATGTDGEFHTLELEQFGPVVAAFAGAVEAAEVPAQAGVGWLTQDGAYARGRLARDAGLVAFQIVQPFWLPLGDRELVRFFEGFGRAFEAIALIHYNTSFGGRVLTGRDYASLLEVAPNLVGSKLQGDDAQLVDCVTEAGSMHHFVLDGRCIPGVALGSPGIYCAMANVNPAWTVGLWEDAVAGRWQEAARKRVLADTFMAEWAALQPHITSWSAQAKVSLAAGLFPEMPLAVRPPYIAGEPSDVRQLREFIARQYPELLVEA
jgi:dihydrodipicolinate synthase/N-acetylneuraminate lyase